MKFEEALKLMREGKKMTTRYYSSKGERYFYFDESGDFKCHYEILGRYGYGVDFLSWDFCNDDWYEYKKPILDDEEKKYLENVIRPFKDRVKSITKTFMPNTSCHYEYDDNYRLDIKALLYNFETVGTIIQLPPFSIKSNMYKGMISNKCYTLKELGLFEKEN